MAKSKRLGVAIIACFPVLEKTVAITATPEHAPIINTAVGIDCAWNTRVNKRTPAGATIFFQTEHARTRRSEIAIIICLAMTVAVCVQNTAHGRVALRRTRIIMMTIQGSG